MSDTEKQVSALTRPVGWTGPVLAARVIRITEFVFTVIALGLTARAKSYFNGEPSADYGVAVAVMSFIYLVAVFFTSFFLPDYYMAGPLLITESLFLIFWLTAFIALAAEFGRGSCDSLYWGREPCRAGQAAIAMSAINMVLFGVSLLLLIVYAVRPLLRTHSGANLWTTAKMSNASFDRGTGLVIYTAPAWVTDPELAAADRQVTASSGEAPVETEKIADSPRSLGSPEPALFQQDPIREPEPAYH